MFIARHYLSMNGYTPSDPNGMEFPCGLESSKSLVKLLDTRHIQRGLPDTYGDIITMLIDRYSYAFGKLLNKFRTNRLMGYELLDILENERYFPSIELPCKGSVCCWSALVGMSDVMFCKHIGEVIVPVLSDSQVASCSARPPVGFNLLVAPIALLRIVSIYTL